MKTTLTSLLSLSFPLFLFGQVSADTSFLFEQSKDYFNEFFWQNQLQISRDSTFYFFETVEKIDSLEILDPSNQIMWTSQKIHSVQTVPTALMQENFYTIRIYGKLGITSMMWFP